jgi:hypothetical protein
MDNSALSEGEKGKNFERHEDVTEQEDEEAIAVVAVVVARSGGLGESLESCHPYGTCLSESNYSWSKITLA